MSDEAFKEMKMPYRDRDDRIALIEQIDELERKLRDERDELERKLRDERDDWEEARLRLQERIDTLKAENRELRSRRGVRGARPEADYFSLEQALADAEVEINKQKEEIDELRGYVKRDGDRCFKLEQERDDLIRKLLDAETLRAHAIATETIDAYLRDPNWLPNSVARATLNDKTLAEQVLLLQREREVIGNAEKDIADLQTRFGGGDSRDLVQTIIGSNRWTVIFPLRHVIAAMRAAINCWAQENMKRVEDLKEKTR